MKLGKLDIEGIAALAPMAGVTDRAFREICIDFGASYVVSEMVSSKGVSYLDRKSMDLMKLSDKEHPAAIQIFGDDPLIMSKASKLAMQYNPDVIDINMGCPAPKVSSNGCGAALMLKPDLCFKIVDAVKNSVDIPVTVKIRKGWDNDNINAVEIAKLCEKAGANAITIHGRTRQQMYMPSADWSIIKQIKDNINIPVIGNGDITSSQDAFDMIEKTGCDMIMIGRGALGNPWIFSQIKNNNNANISIQEKIEVILKHVNLICTYKGEPHGMKEARKHVAWYLKGIKGAAQFRDMAGKLSTLEDLKTLLNKIQIY